MPDVINTLITIILLEYSADVTVAYDENEKGISNRTRKLIPLIHCPKPFHIFFTTFLSILTIKETDKKKFQTTVDKKTMTSRR